MNSPNIFFKFGIFHFLKSTFLCHSPLLTFALAFSRRPLATTNSSMSNLSPLSLATRSSSSCCSSMSISCSLSSSSPYSSVSAAIANRSPPFEKGPPLRFWTNGLFFQCNLKMETNPSKLSLIKASIASPVHFASIPYPSAPTVLLILAPLLYTSPSLPYIPPL